MKKILISVVLLSQGIGAGLKVEPVSAERVSHFQAELTASQMTRDTQFKWAAGAAGTAIIAALIWKGYSDYALGRRDLAKAHINLYRHNRTIKSHKKIIAKKARRAREVYDAAQADRPSNGEWLTSIPGYLWAIPGALYEKVTNGICAVPEVALDGVRATPSTISSIAGGGLGLGKKIIKKTAKLAKKNAPGALAGIGLLYIGKQMSKFILPALPSIGDYFMEVRSIKWCLVKHSDFYNVMINFKNWIAYEIAHNYQAQDTADIVLCGSHLVLETERILGYMAYVTEELDICKTGPGHSFYRKRAEVCMAALAAETNTLAAEINALVSVEVTPEQKEAFIDILRKRLFRIIIQLENFEVVTSAAGMASPYEEDVFGPLKRFIYPEWLLERPTLQDPNHTFLDDLGAMMEEEA